MNRNLLEEIKNVRLTKEQRHLLAAFAAKAQLTQRHRLDWEVVIRKAEFGYPSYLLWLAKLVDLEVMLERLSDQDLAAEWFDTFPASGIPSFNGDFNCPVCKEDEP